MDGPTVPFAPMDLVFSNCTPKVGIAYHCETIGYTVASPVGALLSGLAKPILFAPTPLLRVVANGGLIVGAAAMVGGLTLLDRIAAKGEDASPPWNQDGIQQRLDGLSHNYKVRALDLGAWTGLGMGAVINVIGFRPGGLRFVQMCGLGATVGSLSAMAFIAATLDRTPSVNYNDDSDGEE